MPQPPNKDALRRDFRDGEPSAEQIASGLLVAFKDHDPVETVCALAIVASHLIVTIGNEASATDDVRERLEPGVKKRLMERVVELCADVRTHSAN